MRGWTECLDFSHGCFHAIFMPSYSKNPIEGMFRPVHIRSSSKSTTRESNSMQRELNDLGGAKELALYRLKIAKEDLAAAEVVQMVEEYLNTQTAPQSS